MLTQSALAGIKSFIETHMGYAAYTAGGITYTAQVTVDELQDGRLSIAFIIDDPDESVVITEVSLFDSDGNLWASKAESIEHQNGQDELYRFVISVTE